ncbi:MAG: hypothetical protein LBC40_03725 [Dysgonamonadaceae bacterium]|jgi:hypothetical protein|nr:hypothetical protein [Dysgonamonadaceae bacterium]
MDVTYKTEYQYMPFIVRELEDLVGGLSLSLADLRKDIDSVPPGAFVGVDENGLGHILVAAVLSADATSSDTEYRVKKGHQFKVGQFVTSGDAASVKAYAITAIDVSNADYDVITVGTTLGVALPLGSTLHQVTAQDETGGKGEAPYKPLGITKREVITTGSHASNGVLLRGTVNVANMAFGAPKVFRNALPLIRFE